MAALGMICEWNPFHLGHAWLLRELKRCYSLPVVCVMSGNFVQRGEPAVAEKRARAEMALRCGADVVFELPTVWAMASAERFARGGVALLRRAGALRHVSTAKTSARHCSVGSRAGTRSPSAANARRRSCSARRTRHFSESRTISSASSTAAPCAGAGSVP